jgi:anthranilate phosphoribosyltransferase
MPSLLDSLAAQLSQGRALAEAQAREAAAALAGEAESDDSKAAFLSALARKGETAAEIAALAGYFREVATDPGLAEWAPRAVDIVGTGGDHAGGFNVSTLTTLVLACAGVPVIKHGNRGVTSKCGSADLFAALGVALDAPPAVLAPAMRELGFVFLFAPSWHPAFKRIGPVRRLLAARGERTVFNILGPLLNPARPAHMLIGAASSPLARTLASALDTLGTPVGLTVHGEIAAGRGIDELTSATVNHVRGAGRLHTLDAAWTPESLGVERRPFDELLGGDVASNTALAHALAAGGGPRGLVDTICVNAAVVLWMCGKRPEPGSAVAEARELLQGGPVARKIEQARAFFETHARP